MLSFLGSSHECRNTLFLLAPRRAARNIAVDVLFELPSLCGVGRRLSLSLLAMNLEHCPLMPSQVGVPHPSCRLVRVQRVHDQFACCLLKSLALNSCSDCAAQIEMRRYLCMLS